MARLMSLPPRRRSDEEAESFIGAEEKILFPHPVDEWSRDREDMKALAVVLALLILSLEESQALGRSRGNERTCEQATFFARLKV